MRALAAWICGAAALGAGPAAAGVDSAANDGANGAANDGANDGAGLQLYVFAPRDGETTPTPIAHVDAGPLHVEGRWNYEARGAGSLFVGRRFARHGDLSLELTPMVGIVAGAVDGYVPALELTATWWRLELYSEAEYVFDFQDRAADFAYAWTELSVAVRDWLRAGLVVQRTHLYASKVAVQRGPFVEIGRERLSAGLYVLNIDVREPFLVASLGIRL